MPRSWTGREVPEPKPGDTITVWEVDPHPGGTEFDVLQERGWQDMLRYVNDQLKYWLERYTEEELIEGVTLKFRLVDIRAEDLP